MIIACLFVATVVSVSGQSFQTKKSSNNVDFISIEMNPSIIVIVDSVNYNVDSRTADSIKQKWIEKVMVMKDETTKKLHGNKNGVIFIYTKQEFKNEVLEQLERAEK